MDPFTPRPTRNNVVQIDVNALLQAVGRVFQKIEPWYQATSDDQDVDVLIKGVQIQGCRFSEAIDLSRNTSEDGLKLLGQSVLFARARANGKPIEEMQPDFGSLVSLASDGCEGSEKSMKILGGVYGRFREMNGITGPLLSEGIARRPDRRRQTIQGPQGVLNVARAVGDVVMKITVPPLITLPAPLPEPVSVPLGVNGAYGAPPKRGDRENISLNEALQRLGDIANHIAEVRHHMSNLVGTWNGIKVKLGRLQEQMRENDVAVGEQLSREVEGDWAEVVARYKEYKDRMAGIQGYYNIDFRVDLKEVDFKLKLAKLEENVQRMSGAAEQMESIMKLTHGGDCRIQFQDSMDNVQGGLKGQFAQLISVLEGVEKSIKHSGGVADTDATTRREFRKLLKETERDMPSVHQNIRRLGKILDEEVSTRRLFRAHVFQACDIFLSNSTTGKVFSQADAARVLEGFGDAASEISRFCEVLVLVGIQLDEGSTVGSGRDLEQLEAPLRRVIETLKEAQVALGLDDCPSTPRQTSIDSLTGSFDQDILRRNSSARRKNQGRLDLL